MLTITSAAAAATVIAFMNNSLVQSITNVAAVAVVIAVLQSRMVVHVCHTRHGRGRDRLSKDSFLVECLVLGKYGNRRRGRDHNHPREESLGCTYKQSHRGRGRHRSS